MGSLSPRDRRALALLGTAAVLFVILQYGVLPRSGGGAGSATPVDVLEKRLQRLQQVARQKSRAVAEAGAAARELAEAEKGLLQAATPALASAEMQRIAKELLASQGVTLQASEFGPVKAAGEDYAQVPLTVNFTCGIEQWINTMAALHNAPQVLSTLEVRLAGHEPKLKTVQVRMVVAGYIPASLVSSAKRAGGGV